MKTTRRIHRSHAQWHEIFTQFEASSLSATAFCKQQGIAYGGFMRWRQRVDDPTRHAVQASADDWLPIHVAADAQDDSPTARGWDIELALPGGVQLHAGALRVFPCTARIWLYQKPVDMRRSFDGLAAIAQNVLSLPAASGDWFVFVNRRRTQMKILYFDTGGYCIWA